MKKNNKKENKENNIHEITPIEGGGLGTPVINKSFLNSNITRKTKNEAIAVMQGSKDTDREDIKKEIQRILIEKGIGLERIAELYDYILSQTKAVKYRGTDVLRAIENITRLHGLEDKPQQSEEDETIRAMVQSKTNEEIVTTLIEITHKTQEYLTKIKG